jgi:hypothetical protein
MRAFTLLFSAAMLGMVRKGTLSQSLEVAGVGAPRVHSTATTDTALELQQTKHSLLILYLPPIRGAPISGYLALLCSMHMPALTCRMFFLGCRRQP